MPGSDKMDWRVSAVIPAYNRGEYIGDTIRAIQAQSVPVHEIIVIDDESSDDTAAVVAGFGAAVRYRKIRNSGAPVARHAGASMATGNWLWFCDSDDLWKPDFLSRARALANHEPFFPQFIFGNFCLVRDGVWESRSKFETAPPGYWDKMAASRTPDGDFILEPLYPHLLKFQAVFHSTILMTTAFYHQVGGYDGRFARTGSEDFEFTLRCAERMPTGVITEPLVGIRRHEGNFSGNQLRNLLGEVDILRHALAYHAAAAPLESEILSEIARRSQEALGLAFSDGNYRLVTSLAHAIPLAELSLKSRFKILLATLPPAIRDPALALAGHKTGRTAR
jgi:glycosyltransferase involved in cell wall biosynthesis